MNGGNHMEKKSQKIRNVLNMGRENPTMIP